MSTTYTLTYLRHVRWRRKGRRWTKWHLLKAKTNETLCNHTVPSASPAQYEAFAQSNMTFCVHCTRARDREQNKVE